MQIGADVRSYAWQLQRVDSYKQHHKLILINLKMNQIAFCNLELSTNRLSRYDQIDMVVRVWPLWSLKSCLKLHWALPSLQGHLRMCHSLDLASFFGNEKVPQHYAIIVANQMICTSHFNLFYRRATIKVCADGGYDKLKDWVNQSCLDLDDYLPDYVVGDIDSLSDPHIKKPKFVKIVDQDRNDLQKCISFIREITSDQPHIAVVVIGALGGRFDHELQSLSILYEFGENQVIYLNEKSLVTLLGNGKTDIDVDSLLLGPHCGFGPLNGLSVVTTYGFKWDLKHQGGLVSSSNIAISPQLIIECDEPVLFTIEVQPRNATMPSI